MVSKLLLIYKDEGFSGKNIKRAQFQRLLDDIKAKKIFEQIK
jgi:site-specific DNA recombinase